MTATVDLSQQPCTDIVRVYLNEVRARDMVAGWPLNAASARAFDWQPVMSAQIGSIRSGDFVIDLAPFAQDFDG